MLLLTSFIFRNTDLLYPCGRHLPADIPSQQEIIHFIHIEYPGHIGMTCEDDTVKILGLPFHPVSELYKDVIEGNSGLEKVKYFIRSRTFSMLWT
jgi:hypothetical protein